MFKLLDELHERGLVGIADKLPWRLPIDDGQIMTSHGGFLSGYEYAGPNAQTVSPTELLQIADDVNQTLMQLGSGWAMAFDVCRQRGGRHPDPNPEAPAIAQLYDAERREFVKRSGAHFVTTLHVSPIYHAPRTIGGTASDWVFAGTEGAGPASDAQHEFLKGRDQFERTFSDRLKLRRLGLRASTVPGEEPVVYDDLMSYLYWTMRGIHQPMLAPPPGMTVAKYFAAHELVTDWKPRIDNDAIAVVSVTRPPLSSKLQHLRRLFELEVEFRASLRFVCLGKTEAEQYIERRENEWIGQMQGFWSSLTQKVSKTPAKVNQHSVRMTQDAGALKTRVQGSEVTVVYPSFSLVFFGEDRAATLGHANSGVDRLRDAGFVSEVASVNAGRKYFASLPGDVWTDLGQHGWTSANAAHSVPLTSVWTGVNTHPSSFYPPNERMHINATTTGGALGHYPLHWNTAGHTMLLGAQGSGKSVLMKRLALEHLLIRDMGLFALDRDRSMNLLARALAAEGIAGYYDLEDSNVQLCPLEFIHEGESERAYGVGFIEHLAKLQNINPDIDRRRLIEDGILRMAQTPLRQLSALRSFVPDPSAWKVLDRYCNPNSVTGRMLNGLPNALAERRVLIFETSLLSSMESEDRNPIYRQLLHLMDRMSRHRWKLQTMFDESSVYLSDDFLANYLFEVLRRWRKRIVHAIFATQGVVDIKAAGKLGKALVQECKTRIFCGDSSASDPDTIRDLRDTFAGLTETKCLTIARNAAARSYLYTSPLGEASFNLGLQAVERALSTCDEGEDLDEVMRLANADPQAFVARHLSSRGLEAWATYYESLRARSAQPTFSKKEIAA